jgi:hypothetical protein
MGARSTIFAIFRASALVWAVVGCTEPASESATDEVSQGVGVTWTNAVGVTPSGNSLTKTATQATWAAGAASDESIIGDGYVEFTTAEANTAKMAGLSVGDNGQHWSDIDFAILLKADGTMSVREAGGVTGGNLGTYAAGDTFRVEATTGVVTYTRNGSVFYVSTRSPGFPLRVDTSFSTPGGTINDVHLARSALRWQNTVNVSADANNLRKTGAVGWNAGASSIEKLLGAGFVEFTTAEATAAKMVGLGVGDLDQHHSDIEFALYLRSDGTIRVYEGGVARPGSFGAYTPGDVFRVETDGATVTYRRNGMALYTSGVAPTFPLRVDTSLRDAGATIAHVVLTSTPTYAKASSVGLGDQFGFSLALSGDTLVVGAPCEDNDGQNSGAAYVFRRTGTVWTPQAYLKAPNADPGDQFGYAVAVSGETIAVGAVAERSAATGVNGNALDDSAPDAGAVYVFARTGTVWTQQAYLKASNTDAGDNFGFSVALSGDELAVGAPPEASNATGVGGNQIDNSAPHAGAVYVFNRTGTVWTQQAYLKASNTDAHDLFGHSVALSADTLAVGARDEDSSATGVNGDQADNSASHAGAVYVFKRTGAVWAQEAYVKASNTEGNDLFGHTVALSGDTLAVAAPYEAGAAAGVNGNQADNTAWAAGAAYVFARAGTVWTQQAYIKASSPDYDDRFGLGLALSGNVLAVGAPLEDSPATGVDGNQANAWYSGASGAVYMFERTGTSWGQAAYVKASNTDGGDKFGSSVALDGGLAVGAPLESSAATGVGGNQADNSATETGAAYIY